MSFISCIKWVRKGVAKSNPEKVQLTPEELQKIIDMTKDEMNEEFENDEEMETNNGNPDDRFNLNEYDKEDESASVLFGVGKLVADDDTYKVPSNNEPDSEDEDDIIRPTDNLIAVGHVEGDASILEIYIYNEQDEDLYVHHDILLPTVPLCLEWLSHEPTDPKPGNLMAIGGMSAVIGVWDLDLIDCLEPAYQLGKFSVKKKHNKSHGHKDAVLDLSWNINYKHILASGSVDKTVLLWDLDVGRASTTIRDFTDKVQCLKWRPGECHSLIAGSSDKSARIFDCRLDEGTNKWEFHGEVEKVDWCPWETNQVLIGTNEGNIHCYDLRSDKIQMWEIKAHEKEITGLEVDGNCPGMLVTCSMDGYTKIWDITTEKPVCRHTKSYGLGEMQCVALNPDCPYVACMGGTKKKKNFTVVNLQKEMEKSNPTLSPNLDCSNPGPSNAVPKPMDLAESAFKSLSIKNKSFKSKKKYGHKFKK